MCGGELLTVSGLSAWHDELEMWPRSVNAGTCGSQSTTTDAISWRNRSSINGSRQLRHWKQLTNKKLLADNDEEDTIDRAFEKMERMAICAGRIQLTATVFTLRTGVTRRGHDEIGKVHRENPFNSWNFLWKAKFCYPKVIVNSKRKTGGDKKQ